MDAGGWKSSGIFIETYVHVHEADPPGRQPLQRHQLRRRYLIESEGQLMRFLHGLPPPTQSWGGGYLE